MIYLFAALFLIVPTLLATLIIVAAWYAVKYMRRNSIRNAMVRGTVTGFKDAGLEVETYYDDFDNLQIKDHETYYM